MGMIDLGAEIAGIKLKNPVIASSGTFGYGTEYSGVLEAVEFGAVVLKGVTLCPREGNPPPRLFETACGLLNSVGLENDGIDSFVRDRLPGAAMLGVPVFANISGTADETAVMLKKLEGTCVSAVELNLSCPNIRGEIVSSAARTAGEFVSRARRASRLPLIAKLSPRTTDIGEVARACESEGADAVSLVNTFPAMAIDIESRRPALGNVTGGLSGPAIKPAALLLVREACLAVDIPVIGMGGIATGVDALEFVIAGAEAVSVGTAVFADPSCVAGIKMEIASYLERKGKRSLKEIRNTLDDS